MTHPTPRHHSLPAEQPGLPRSDSSAWQAVIEALPAENRPAAWRAFHRLSRSSAGEDGVFPQFLLLCTALTVFMDRIPARTVEAAEKASCALTPQIRTLREATATQDQIVARLDHLLGQWKWWAIAVGAAFLAGLGLGIAI